MLMRWSDDYEESRRLLVFAITAIYFDVVGGRHKWRGISLQLVYSTIPYILHTTRTDRLQFRYGGQVDI